jgi:hypothetical protein
MNKDLEILDKKDGINKEPSVTQDETGYIKVNISKLPSGGLFYPKDVYIGYKPATVKEIRYWSMIDEEDEYSFIEAMNFVLDSCIKIKTTKSKLSIDDLCEVDRLYLIFAIREATFTDGKNNVIVDIPYSYKNKEYKDSVEVTTNNINYFKLTDFVKKRYNESKRAIEVKGNNEFKIKLPSVGVSNWVQNYINTRIENGKPVDPFFAKVAPFIIDDYSTLTEEEYFKMETESIGWSIEDVSALDIIVKELSKGTKQGFKHKTEQGGSEVVVPLRFRHGIKSIFIISDILG